ncbi:MaoC family dehydratase [Ferrimicrobium sp.]|uniref:MaoC family dehydratase n=1 Tax=Ferrimicrobium sp. TaxID=2926050 RepID=UPI00261E6D6C|nr:MaoC family dehydratase [Ferrimicrobium sp.]
MSTHFFEDYQVGAEVRFGPIMVDPEEMVAFARQWDPQPFHIDPQAASQSIYGGIIASGWFTCVLAMRELVANYLSPESSLGSPGLDDLQWRAPVRAGDRLWLACTVVEARPSQTRADRGIVKTRIEMSQEGAPPALSMVATNFVLRRHHAR